jgi:hypothetical protein
MRFPWRRRRIPYQPANPHVPEPAAVPVHKIRADRQRAGRAAPIRPLRAVHPVTQTSCGLLTGVPTATRAIPAVVWSAAIALTSYLSAVRLYNRRRAPTPA